MRWKSDYLIFTYNKKMHTKRNFYPIHIEMDAKMPLNHLVRESTAAFNLLPMIIRFICEN